MVYHPNSIYNTNQKSWRITSSREINDHIGNECLEKGFYPMVIELIALSLKVPIIQGVGHQNVTATIAICVFMHLVNTQLLMVHVFHMVR